MGRAVGGSLSLLLGSANTEMTRRRELSVTSSLIVKGQRASLGPPHRYPERDEKMGIRPIAE